MKKHIIFYSAILISTFLFSCKDNNAFTISGTITNPGSLKKVYLLEADTSQLAVVDSTNLSEQGKFQFKRSTPFANLYKIRMGGTIFDIIAKNGESIEFSTNLTDNTHAYNITGSEESDKIKEFNNISNFYGDNNTKLSSEYQDKAQALGKESDSLVKIYQPMFMKNMNDYANAVMKFVNENK